MVSIGSLLLKFVVCCFVSAALDYIGFDVAVSSFLLRGYTLFDEPRCACMVMSLRTKTLPVAKVEGPVVGRHNGQNLWKLPVPATSRLYRTNSFIFLECQKQKIQAVVVWSSYKTLIHGLSEDQWMLLLSPLRASL
jgi:hypothetical protein